MGCLGVFVVQRDIRLLIDAFTAAGSWWVASLQPAMGMFLGFSIVSYG